MAFYTRTVLITAASGNIGTELVPLMAREANTKLILPTRSAAKLRSNLSASQSPNAHIEEGHIANPVWVESLLKKHNVDTVFLCLQGGYGVELDTTLNILDAMKRSGTVKQCVYVSICGDFVSPAGIEKLSRLCSAGHMLVKIPIESKLKFGGYPWDTTVLGPTLFFTNDGRSKTAMLESAVFNEPLDRASRVSPKDIALAARNIMFAPGGKYAGRKIQLGSLHQFSGAEVAALWAAALGKEEELRPWDGGEEAMDLFEAEGVKVWGPAFARDIRLMYENFKAMGFGMSGEEYNVQVEVLGKEAADYGEWVRETGKQWVKEGV